jgi:hypothetical protein
LIFPFNDFPSQVLYVTEKKRKSQNFFEGQAIFNRINRDGLVKSPSAALRFNFVVAAHLVSALHSSVFARLASGAFYKTIVLVTFSEILNRDGLVKSSPASSGARRANSHLSS